MEPLIIYDREETPLQNALRLIPVHKETVLFGNEPYTEDLVRSAYWDYLYNVYLIRFAEQMLRLGRIDVYDTLVELMSQSLTYEDLDDTVDTCVRIYRYYIKTQVK